MRLVSLALILSLGAAEPSRTVAIRDATLVPAPFIRIEKGTVVLRDGLIEDVGTAVKIPEGAEVIDGTGLVVYAGFIDGRSTLGLPDTKRSGDALKLAEGEKPDFTQEAPSHMEQANRKGLRPEFDAAEALALSEADLKKAHAGGFAVAVVAAGDEFLSGRAAAITLSGEPRRNSLLRAGTGVHASLKSYGEGYPGTTMGAIAHLRQILLDAGHYHQVVVAWKRGRPRPAIDPALEALHVAVAGSTPFFFEAESDKDILRALALADEFGLKPAITGAGEAWRIATLLDEKDIPVVLTLRLPKERPKKKDDDAPEPAKLLRERERLDDEAIRCAQKLHEANVRFCFSSAGLGSPSETLAAVARRVEKGLKPEAALAALTTSPARLFGLRATHGTIQKGKAANLTVLTSPLGDKKAAVRYVFADGRKFEFEAKKDDKKEEKKAEKKDEPPVAASDDRDVELDADRVPKTRTGGNVLIRGAVLHTVSGAGTLQGGSLLVRGGKIVAVGAAAPAPPGVTVIDGAGLHVMPGIIDCHSHICTDGGLNEGTQSVTPEVRVRDVIDPRDVAMYRALAGGVTSANILHGSANAIGGQNAVIKLKYGKLPQEILFHDAPRGVKFALGENPKQSNFNQNRGKRFPNTRMGMEAVYRRAFTEAQEYEKTLKADPLTRRDLRLETLVSIMKGDILVHCHSYRADEILMILQVAKDFGFRIQTLQHVLEGYRVAPEIAAAGTGASTFSDWWAYKIEAFEAIPYNAALMTRAGILTSINSDSPEQIRHLNVEAGKTMKYGGLTEQEAIALVTINPARQLGIDRFAGSIEKGKDADLAIYNGHPLSPYSRCVMTLIDGEVYFEDRDVPRNASPGFTLADRPLRMPLPLPPSGPVAIRNARIHPVTDQSFNGTIVISDGKIAALGRNVSTPPGAAEIDATNLHVYPGLMDAHTSMGLAEIGSVAGTRDETEIGGIQPDLKALTAVNPHSDMIPVTRANGITSVLSAPVGGMIAGQSAVIRLDGWVPADMALKEVFALHVNMPVHRDTDETKAEDERHLKEFREPFSAAKRYDGKPRDLKLEAMLPYVRGERPVVFEANTAKEIRAALKFAGEFNLKTVISGGRDAWQVASLLAEKKVPVIIGGVMELPGQAHDPYTATFSNAARLSKAGVKFAISSADSFAGNSRNTPYHAAWASAYGLPRDEALKAVTIYPAEILGVADRVGSLEVGKAADLIVTTGDPLEVVTDIVYEFIAGRAVPLDSKHTRSYEKFKQRPDAPKKSGLK